MQVQDFENVLEKVPTLKQVLQYDTLSDYFSAKMTPFLADIKNITPESLPPERQFLLKAIQAQIQRLYGPEIAHAVTKQLQDFPVTESRMHLSFLRDFDDKEKTKDSRSCLNQGSIISAVLTQSCGYSFHIGAYGSNVSLDSQNSGGFFQLGPCLFPVADRDTIKHYVLTDAPHLAPEYYHEGILILTKLTMLYDVLPEGKTKTLIKDTLFNHQNQSYTPALVFKKYSDLSKKNKEFITINMQKYALQAKEKFGFDFQDVEQQYQYLQNIFKQNLPLSQEVALSQQHDLNTSLNGHITHLSIDIIEVVRDFFIQSLNNPESVWYRIFNDSQKKEAFQKAFVGIQTAWGTDESPFDKAEKNNKGFTKYRTLKNTEMPSSVSDLTEMLEKREIYPSNLMLILAFQSAGIVTHGGKGQSQYSFLAKEVFQNFLQQHFPQEKNYQKILEHYPADLVITELATAMENGKPMKISRINTLAPAVREQLLTDIPSYPCHKAVQNAVNSLAKNIETQGFESGHSGTIIQTQQKSNKTYDKTLSMN